MPAQVMTVLGPVAVAAFGLTDAHSHVWIEPVPGAAAGAPQLFSEAPIAQELRDYWQAGGSGIIDCQPGACGRNGNVLARLAQASGVHIVACSGFHRQRYYGPGASLWQLTAAQARDHFVGEFRQGLSETRHSDPVVYPGFLKIAAEATLHKTRRQLLEAAAQTSLETGCAIEMHTEKGQGVADFLRFFQEQGVAPQRLIFCHVDKRPDVGLHCELAQAGVMLEYDTFYRPKYQPEKHLWPLIKDMVQAGHRSQLALATDMASSAMWQRLGGQPGLVAFITFIKPRLEQMGFDQPTIEMLLGGNITNRLAISP